MNRLILLLVAFIMFNANAFSTNGKANYKTLEQLNIEAEIFENDNFFSKELEVIEIEEEVTINFDTKNYLPEDFNALKGMYDLHWNTLDLVGVQEKLGLNIDTNLYLPENFNALAGMYDLDWNTIELIEIEEVIELGFDTENYLPVGFNPYSGMNCEREVVVFLY